MTIGGGDVYPVEKYAMIRTTKAQFQQFKRDFMRYVKLYGLIEWRFDIVHADCGNAYSTVNANSPGKVVTVCFNTVWCDRSGLPLTRASIRATARHEANEMLVSDICDLIETPFKTRDQVEATRHALVRRLDNIIE
jgi:hypothetical protein